MEESTNKMHKGFKIFIVILIVGLLFFMNESNRTKISGTFLNITTKEKSLGYINSIGLEEDVNTVEFYDDTIVKWSSNKLSFLKSDGSLLWEKEYSFENPSILHGEKSIYVSDKSTGHIYSMDKNGDTIYKTQLNEPFFVMRESNGNLMIHIKDLEMEKVNILDKAGDSIRIHTVDDSHILTYNVNQDNSKYMVSWLDMKDDVLKSGVGIYTMAGQQVEKIDLQGEIVIYTQFIKDDIMVLTEKNLYFIKNGKTQWKREFPIIKDIQINKNIISILYDTNFETIDLDGKTVDKYIFAANYNKIKVYDKYVFLHGNRDVMGIHNSKEVLRYKSDKDINGLYYYQNSVYLHSADEIGIYGFTNKKE